MLRIRIICAGKLKEKYWDAACSEYIRRLGGYCKPQIIEVKESKLPSNPSRADEINVITREGEDILSRIDRAHYVIALDVGGTQLGSEELARRISEISFNAAVVDFVIGGSLGLSDEVKKRADMRLSFGKMTLPHQLARVVLLEQIYRAFKINAGETYHK